MKVTLFLLPAVAFAQLPGNWPAAYTVPAPVAEWTNNLRLSNASLSTIVRKCVRSGEWALTFDDGPSPQTRRVLEYLRQQNNTKATFFVVGSRVVQNPEILRETYEAGHQIALHSWSHADLATLSTDQLVSDFMWSIKAVKEAIGVTPRFFRPPLGSINDQVCRVAGALGLSTVDWNRDTNDWRINGNPDLPGVIRTNVRSWAADESEGVILLQHDLYPDAVDLVPDILKAVLEEGNKIVHLGTCLDDMKWYSDAPEIGTAKPANTSQSSERSTDGLVRPNVVSGAQSASATNLLFIYILFSCIVIITSI